MSLTVAISFAALWIAQNVNSDPKARAREVVGQYYQEYLARHPWGVASSATSFKFLALGQRLDLGEGTNFRLCKPIKDINGRNTCWNTDLSTFECPFTPPAITCKLRPKNDQVRHPQLAALRTAFGNTVQEISLDLLLETLGERDSTGRISGRLASIRIEVANPSETFVPNAIEHFTQAVGSPPQREIDQQDRATISTRCKKAIDELYAGKPKGYTETMEALKKCETDSIEKFFVSTARSTGYTWQLSDPGHHENKIVYLGLDRDLIGLRGHILMAYKSGPEERDFRRKVDSYLQSLKDMENSRSKSDF